MFFDMMCKLERRKSGVCGAGMDLTIKVWVTLKWQPVIWGGIGGLIC